MLKICDLHVLLTVIVPFRIDLHAKSNGLRGILLLLDNGLIERRFILKIFTLTLT